MAAAKTSGAHRAAHALAQRRQRRSRTRSTVGFGGAAPQRASTFATSLSLRRRFGASAAATHAALRAAATAPAGTTPVPSADAPARGYGSRLPRVSALLYYRANGLGERRRMNSPGHATTGRLLPAARPQACLRMLASRACATARACTAHLLARCALPGGSRHHAVRARQLTHARSQHVTTARKQRGAARRGCCHRMTRHGARGRFARLLALLRVPTMAFSSCYLFRCSAAWFCAATRHRHATRINTYLPCAAPPALSLRREHRFSGRRAAKTKRAGGGMLPNCTMPQAKHAAAVRA